jgi:hypothetical protein
MNFGKWLSNIGQYFLLNFTSPFETLWMRCMTERTGVNLSLDKRPGCDAAKRTAFEKRIGLLDGGSAKPAVNNRFR